MDTATKYSVQRDDAAKKIWIDIQEPRIEVCAFIDSFSWEWLTLWKAIKDLAPQITVIGDMIWEDVTFILWSDNSLRQWWSAAMPFYCMNQNNRFRTPLHGNYGIFKWVSWNKRLTSTILGNAWINVPREISLNWQDYYWLTESDFEESCGGSFEQAWEELWRRRTKHIKEFVKSLWKWKKAVFKPIDGQCGRDIHMLSYGEITNERLNDDVLFIDWNMLVQEKIDSYPIIDEQWNRKDWNVRVLTTTDKKWNIVIAGITWRIDEDWWPVNRSITADNISLIEISKLAWWSESTYIDIKKKIEDIAIKSINIILSKIKPWMFLESQDLAGVDIIIWEDLEPFVIEVNDSDSGCIYELMCLEGIESIYPIAESAIRKIKLAYWIKELREMFQNEFWKHTEILIELIMHKDIKMEDIEWWISFLWISENWKKFLEFIKVLDQVKLEEQQKLL